MSKFTPYKMPERLESERLVYCKPVLEWAEIVFQGTVETVEDLQPWLPWAQNPQIEGSEKFLSGCAQGWNDGSYFDFVVFEKGLEGTVEGFVGCMGYNKVNPKVPAFDIGYWCRKSKQGQGYAKEAAEFFTDYGMNQMQCKRLQIRVDTENKASNAVAQYLMTAYGYVLEGVQKNDTFFDWSDNPVRSTNIYALYGK